MQKLYCYVDETGQDIGSTFFWVVAVVSDQDQHALREELDVIEVQAHTGARKWHKSRPQRRIDYLSRVLDRGICAGSVFAGCYAKPLPFFLPMLEVVAQAIESRASADYRVTVIVDGIDKKKARELAGGLRVRGIRSVSVKGHRDESEPMLRLADMWAGAIRSAADGEADAAKVVEKARRVGYLVDLKR